MDELTRAFLPIVEDPAQVALLYAQLREFCHDMRNRLGEHRMAAYMARRSELPDSAISVLEQFEVRYLALLRFLDDLQTICRPLHPNRSQVSLGEFLYEAQRRWAAEFVRHGRMFQASPPGQPIVGNFDTFLLAHALDAFVAWRAAFGGSQSPVSTRWRVEGRWIVMIWHEPEAVPGPASSVLPSLAPVILGRVVQIHGGTLRMVESDGFRLEIHLPTNDSPRSEGVARDGHSESFSKGPASPIHALCSLPAPPRSEVSDDRAEGLARLIHIPG